MSFITPLIYGVVSEGCTVRPRGRVPGARGARNLGAGLSLAKGIRGAGGRSRMDGAAARPTSRSRANVAES
jgi:hypothetical protein